MFPSNLQSRVSCSLNIQGRRELKKKLGIPKSAGQQRARAFSLACTLRVPPARVQAPGSPYLNVCVLHRLKRLEGGGRTQALQTLGDVGYVKSPRPQENGPM